MITDKKVRLGLYTVELLGLVEQGGIRVNVPDDLLIRYTRNLAEMNKIQKEFDSILQKGTQ